VKELLENCSGDAVCHELALLHISDSGFRVHDLWFMVFGSQFRVQD
jgi:hypothetical protein